MQTQFMADLAARYTITIAVVALSTHGWAAMLLLMAADSDALYAFVADVYVHTPAHGRRLAANSEAPAASGYTVPKHILANSWM